MEKNSLILLKDVIDDKKYYLAVKKYFETSEDFAKMMEVLENKISSLTLKISEKKTACPTYLYSGSCEVDSLEKELAEVSDLYERALSLLNAKDCEEQGKIYQVVIPTCEVLNDYLGIVVGEDLKKFNGELVEKLYNLFSNNTFFGKLKEYNEYKTKRDNLCFYKEFLEEFAATDKKELFKFIEDKKRAVKIDEEISLNSMMRVNSVERINRLKKQRNRLNLPIIRNLIGSKDMIIKIDEEIAELTYKVRKNDSLVSEKFELNTRIDSFKETAFGEKFVYFLEMAKRKNNIEAKKFLEKVENISNYSEYVDFLVTEIEKVPGKFEELDKQYSHIIEDKSEYFEELEEEDIVNLDNLTNFINDSEISFRKTIALYILKVLTIINKMNYEDFEDLNLDSVYDECKNNEKAILSDFNKLVMKKALDKEKIQKARK